LRAVEIGPERPVARIGILGGTFNPPHLGHLALARHALGELGLEHVVLMPAYRPPHKPVGEDPGPEHRLEMCRLAVRDTAGVSACAHEVQRGGVSYTVDTLRALSESRPRTSPTLILGADTACTLASWREPAALLELAELAVAEREGEGREAVGEALLGLHPAPRVRFLAMAPVDVSSSRVRMLAARGERVDELVGGAVAAYIAEHGLYARDLDTVPS
jgi:nicotinate-nucleotide adenylyltransferase